MISFQNTDGPALILFDIQKGFENIEYWGGQRNNPKRSSIFTALHLAKKIEVCKNKYGNAQQFFQMGVKSVTHILIIQKWLQIATYITAFSSISLTKDLHRIWKRYQKF